MKTIRLGISAFLLFTVNLLWTRTLASVQDTDAVWTIPFGDPMRGVIVSPHDEIVYKIATPFLGRILIHLQVPVDCDLYVYDQNQQELGFYKQAGNASQSGPAALPVYVSSTTFSLTVKIKPFATGYVPEEPFLLTTTRDPMP